jgi:acetyl esterase/lipase
MPTLTEYRAPEATRTGATIVVCPGGGYEHLADHEGEPVAQWLNTLGIDAFVLKYRLGPDNRHPAMLQDAARAIRTVRSTAETAHRDPARVGVLGFSAGGHLSSTISTQFDAGDPNAADPIDRVSSRPDLSVLIYPVITMDMTYGHTGSRHNLIGADASQELIDALSNDKRVTEDTPPAYLVHSVDDDAVPVEHALMYAAALRKHSIPFEMHIYEHGGHGYGLAHHDAALNEWQTACAHWLRRHGFAR